MKSQTVGMIGLGLLGSAIASRLLVKVERAGFGAEDNSAILRAFELE